MLRTLCINNIALIEYSEIEFSRGLNILTGETGAGKSIIIDSLNFVLGGRADKSLIRYGQNEATVEAEFEDINERVLTLLNEYEIDASEGLIITRKMTVDGKNSCRINGIKLTVGSLKTIASSLVDIYGQHENSILLDSSTHIDIIDSFGGLQLNTIKANYIEVFKKYKNIKSALVKYKSMQDVEIRLEILEKQIKEIENANLSIGEEDKLQKLCDSYDNVESILVALNNSYILLSDGETNAIDYITNSIKELNHVAEYNDVVAECVTRLEELSIELSDIASCVSKNIGNVDFDEYEAKENIDRLEYIREIESKYGKTEREVLEYYDKISKEYEDLGNRGFEVARLVEDLEVTKVELCKKAKELTNIRLETGKTFASSVITELRELGMPNTTFVVDIEKIDDSKIIEIATVNGVDKLEFLISPNAGQPLKPLAKIISGGEMSRFMLAIKKISAQIDGVNCMVFDEIDTGISGNIAQVVANKLYDISISRQVLAVTHLPQLSSIADNHYLISKTTDNISTQTHVELLGREDSIKEIARIIDGTSDSEFALKHASKIKDDADKYKIKNN